MPDMTLLPELLTQLWLRFILVALFGFLTGLEFREYILLRSRERPDTPAFRLGTSRTFTFIAILGYTLYILDPGYRLYLAGMLGLLIFFGLFYQQKLKGGQSGLLQPLVGLIVYTYGPLVSLQPPWFLFLLFVAVVFTLGARQLSHRFIEHLEPQEIPTLAKFLLLSGVILPLLPDRAISPYVPATPFNIWLAVVAISAISYTGYILKKYLLKRQGYLFTGLLGGLYSSTAATVVLARKSRELASADPSLSAGIAAASGMMYLRLLGLTAIMNLQLLPLAALPLGLLGLISLGFALAIDRRGVRAEHPPSDLGRSNPLELGIALLFALLFVVMMVITQQVISHFGGSGLNILSLGVGFTDIDPFVLSILSGHYLSMGSQQLVGAILVAAGSNNLLKAIYAYTLGGHRHSRGITLFLILLGLVSIVYGLVQPKLA